MPAAEVKTDSILSVTGSKGLPNSIRVVGARTHNLKNLTVEIPRDQFVVITGRSGSGKSSLAIDTIFAEGQRQYVESLSIYSRQFFKQLPAAEVDLIEGLPPTICLDQKHRSTNRRSTVGTITEIYDYLRLLMARVGKIHCYGCGLPITQHTPQQISSLLMGLAERTKLMILAPMAGAISNDYSAVIKLIRRERLVRVRINGEIVDIEQVPQFEAASVHSIDAVTDRIIVRDGVEDRLLDAIEFAQRLSGGRVIVCSLSPNVSGDIWHEQAFDTRYACAGCNIEYGEIQPRTFSFNSPHGACENCQGLGEIAKANESGTHDSPVATCKPEVNDRVVDESEFPFVETCTVCDGSRLGKPALAVFVCEKNMAQVVELPIERAIPFFQNLTLDDDLEQIAAPLKREILHRLQFLMDVGVGYLTLGRGANTLSGGEHQRVRLATSIGSGLSNIGYILDEPSIGLHQRDNDRLIDSIRNLQREGNSVILVEHDEATIRCADYVIDMGPGAGLHGGEIIAQGTPAEISNNSESLTGDYLAGRRRIETPTTRRSAETTKRIELVGASGRNLKSVSVEIPLGVLVCVTGVSGSGKSTLINQTLVPVILQRLERATSSPQPYESVSGIDSLDTLIVVDQKPIGKSARGCPATVTGIMDSLRKVFAATKKAKQLGFRASRFTFNSKSGWCPECRGHGIKRIEMNFMPDFYVPCESCQGRRFNLQTLQVKYNEQSIADVLAMSIERAREFFDGFEHVARPLQAMLDVGLGYLTLGQSTVTLSGGESQRLKLATELARRDTGHTLYVLDEPTTGLHVEDIRVLLSALHRLVDNHNSMIVIEHNLDVIRCADWVIDLGPDGGDGGGELLACGTPEQIAMVAKSCTGRYLRL